MRPNRELLALLPKIKRLAVRYKELTGKPLGVTGEVAELEAAHLLGLRLAPARTAGFDAVERRHGRTWRLQIKGRCMRGDGKPGQRVGAIGVEKEWDAALLVLLDEHFDAERIYEADRAAVVKVLEARGPGLRARNDMSVEKFRSIGKLRWQAQTGDRKTG